MFPILVAHFWSTVVEAAYRLQSGDILEVSVVGMPELKERLAVGLDGTVSVPLAGRVQAAGLPFPEVETAIRDALASKVVQSRTADGRPSSIVIEPNQIRVAIAEYRPIYVTGDVAAPGEHKYRPGLTVRQALALAGGVSALPGQRISLAYDVPELQAQVAALASELARDKTRAVRFQAEIDGKTEFTLDEGLGPLLPRNLLATITRLEADQLKARQANHANELQHLQRLSDQVRSELATLRQQQQQQQEAVQQQTADLARVRSSFEKGVLATTRVSEEQRALNLAGERLLETNTRIAQRERSLEEIGRQRQKTVDQRRLTTLQELADTRFKIATTQSRLQGASEKLALAATPRHAQTLGRQLRLTIHRSVADGSQMLDVTESAELLPGDTIEVNLNGVGVPPSAHSASAPREPR